MIIKSVTIDYLNNIFSVLKSNIIKNNLESYVSTL